MSDMCKSGHDPWSHHGIPECRRCGARLDKSPQWTTEPPTEPGWYWGWKDHGAVEYFEVCEVAERYGKLCVMITNHEDECDLDQFTHWLRIEAPEVPK